MLLLLQKTQTKNLSLISSGLIISFLFSLVLLLTPKFLTPAQAAYDGGVLDGETLQTNPKDRQIKVSAVMPDVLPPSTPILIAPPNHSLLNNNQITFTWYGSVDNVAMSHYQLWLNGKLYLDNIPLITTGTEKYTLTVDQINQIFYLLLNPPIHDGSYTWNILAVDTSQNATSSATWDFMLDTQAPLFIINKVDTTAVNISAYNPSSIPTIPIKLDNADPWLDGVGEADSQVELVVKDENNQLIMVYHFRIGTDGTWEINLGDVLSPDIIYSLNFTIADQVGNVSQIKNLPVIWPTKQIELKPPAFVVPYQPPKESTTKPPSLTLPLPSPEIIKAKIIQKFKNLLPPKGQLLFSQGLYHISQARANLWWISWLALFVFILPTVSFFIWAGIKLKVFSKAGLNHLFWLFFPKNSLGGIIFAWPSLEPISFAVAKLIRTSQTGEKELVARSLTDDQGFFPELNLLDQTNYYLEVEHAHLSFPTHHRPKIPLAVYDFYRKELVQPDASGILPRLIVPVDPVKTPVNQRLWVKWYLLAKFRGKQTLLHLMIILIITFIFTSWVNLAVAIFYSGLLLYKIKKKSS